MKNVLLNQLGSADIKQLEPFLKTKAFKQQSVLFEAEKQIKHVYFPAGAVVSLVVTLTTGETIEAAMVGTDGVIGASAALDGRIALSQGIVPLAGDIIVCEIDA